VQQNIRVHRKFTKKRNHRLEAYRKFSQGLGVQELHYTRGASVIVLVLRCFLLLHASREPGKILRYAFTTGVYSIKNHDTLIQVIHIYYNRYK
jgi:hypothetical protein